MITSYKNRSIDYSIPVELYRCLTRSGNTYSLRQNGKVVGHTSDLEMYFVHFHISRAGKERCRKEQQRNVHAYAEGFLINGYGSKLDIGEKDKPLSKLKYNPYSDKGFMADGKEVKYTKFLKINNKGIFIL